ncbi:MAG: hypothetical protein ACK4SX_15585, partial [Alcanivoracaceae bacterium]
MERRKKDGADSVGESAAPVIAAAEAAAATEATAATAETEATAATTETAETAACSSMVATDSGTAAPLPSMPAPSTTAAAARTLVHKGDAEEVEAAKEADRMLAAMSREDIERSARELQETLSPALLRRMRKRAADQREQAQRQ